MEEYMSRRNGVCRHQSGENDKSGGAITSSSASSGAGSGSGVSVLTTPSASSAASPQRSSGRECGVARAAAANTSHNADIPTPSWTDKHVSVVRDAVFGTLAGLARDALKAVTTSASKNHAASGAAADERLLLFNEQFVVKPPQSSIEFGWHTVRECDGGAVVSMVGVPAVTRYP